VRIGLVDTGINPDHETFDGSRLTVHRIEPEEDGLDVSGRQHGTAVAAILAGAAGSRSPGLLPDAEIVAVDAFYRAGDGDERSDAFLVARALDFLASREVDVANLSLAGPANLVLERMVAALSEEMVLVAAAGNGGPRTSPAHPAAYPGVIAVTAVDGAGRPWRRSPRGPEVDLAAPGVEVWTAASIRGARPKTGTSFAAPFVTATAALALGGRGEASPAEVARLLSERARDLGEPGRDDIHGDGLVQATGLCDAVGGSLVADPAG
jgi:subtilisin family serine protease